MLLFEICKSYIRNGVDAVEAKSCRFKKLKTELTRFMMSYKFGLDELNTKINILQQEFQYIHDYNPIEHVKSRIKTTRKYFEKAL